MWYGILPMKTHSGQGVVGVDIQQNIHTVHSNVLYTLSLFCTSEHWQRNMCEKSILP